MVCMTSVCSWGKGLQVQRTMQCLVWLVLQLGLALGLVPVLRQPVHRLLLHMHPAPMWAACLPGSSSTGQ